MPLSYVFFGTPSCCLPVLEQLTARNRLPLALVCQPDRPKGRGAKICAPSTKQWAAQFSLPVLQPPKAKDSHFLEAIGAMNPDLGVVFAFGQLLPKELLGLPRLGFINIHPSLLPRYRGAAPIQWALINGDKSTGVTILKVTPRLDDGDILLQKEVAIAGEENAVDLEKRLAVLGGELALEALDILERISPCFRPQKEADVIWAPSLSKEDGKIDWGQSSVSLHNRIRGVQPWPGATCRLNGKLLKIHRAALWQGASSPSPYPSGQVVQAEGDRIIIQTGDGFISLLEIQQEGKKVLKAQEFLRGRAIQVGDRLE